MIRRGVFGGTWLSVLKQMLLKHKEDTQKSIFVMHEDLSPPPPAALLYPSHNRAFITVESLVNVIPPGRGAHACVRLNITYFISHRRLIMNDVDGGSQRGFSCLLEYCPPHFPPPPPRRACVNAGVINAHIRFIQTRVASIRCQI